MITLSNIFGWNYFADWSSENSLKNFSVVNIETAMALAWRERYAWAPSDATASFKRNFTTGYGLSGIAYWWLTLIPHVKTSGRYILYDGETPPSGADSGYGWKGIAAGGGTITGMILSIQGSWFFGNSYIPDSMLWPYALSVAEMEDLIGETILPYPYNWPLFSAKYYLQFYKIINAIKHRLYYAGPSSWFPAGISNPPYTTVATGISLSAAVALMSQPNIYSIYLHNHNNEYGLYDLSLKALQNAPVADNPEDVYIRLVSPNGAVLWPATAAYGFYRHFEPGNIFGIDPPQIPALSEGAYLSQAIDLVSIEDRVSVADKFSFQNP